MKYNNINFELPRLGEYVIIIDENDNKYIGYFYERLGERLYESVISLSDERCFFATNERVRFGYLPKMRDFNDNPPPVGKTVMVWFFDSERGSSFSEYTNILDYKCKSGIELIGWYYFEDFDEDK